MNFEDFQQLARMAVIGSLDDEEQRIYEHGRACFGPAADAFLDECRQLEAALALTLPPHPSRPESKRRLLDSIRARARACGEGPVDRRTRTGKDRPLHAATENEMSE